ncbi:hypothetical protein C8Q79DRAFT_1008139 [Trametes meyenii]|nr:hypothetical protein C8Q79DRAFT_1008139 [Trametes meyenii]
MAVVSNEEKASILEGPSEDPALQDAAIYPDLPNGLQAMGDDQYVFGWKITYERCRRLCALFHNEQLPDTPRPNEVPGNTCASAIMIMFVDIAGYAHRWFYTAAALDAPALTKEDRETGEREDFFETVLIHTTIAHKYDRVRLTQAQYEWMARAMGGEPEWFRWPLEMAGSRSMFEDLWLPVSCRGCDEPSEYHPWIPIQPEEYGSDEA